MMNTNVLDWGQPLEAVHVDGRVVPVSLDPEYPAPDSCGNYTLEEEPAPDSYYVFTADGKSWMDESHEWTIRNALISAVTPTPDMAGEMEVLTRRIAAGFHLPHVNDDGITPYEAVAAAQAIVRALPPLPDPDIQVARDIWADGVERHSPNYAASIRSGGEDNATTFRAVLAALKRGKQ